MGSRGLNLAVLRDLPAALLRREPPPATAEDVRRLAYGILRNTAANARRRREQPADPSLLDEGWWADPRKLDAEALPSLFRKVLVAAGVE